MAGDCGLNALSLLPENVLPQWQQKICTSCRKSWLVGILLYFGAGWIFRTKCDFLQVLDLLIFLQKQPGHWAEVVCIFTFYYIPILFAKCLFSPEKKKRGGDRKKKASPPLSYIRDPVAISRSESQKFTCRRVEKPLPLRRENDSQTSFRCPNNIISTIKNL